MSLRPRSIPDGRNAPRLEPLHVRDTRPRVYCWHRHARFVSEWMMQNLHADVSVVSVSDPNAIKGHEDGVFVQVRDVDTPNDRYADALADVAITMGFTILTIDDYPKRRKWEGR